MKKNLKIMLILILTFIGIIIIDTIQAKVFNNSPIISFRYKLDDNGSYVDKGILVDTYYCVKEQDIVTVYVENKFSKFSCPIDDMKANATETNQKIIMINDKLYYETSKDSTIGIRCGVMDGYIKSSVVPTEIPILNDQSNFGIGYGYQKFGSIVEVFIDGKIIVFEQLTN